MYLQVWTCESDFTTLYQYQPFLYFSYVNAHKQRNRSSSFSDLFDQPPAVKRELILYIPFIWNCLNLSGVVVIYVVVEIYVSHFRLDSLVVWCMYPMHIAVLTLWSRDCSRDCGVSMTAWSLPVPDRLESQSASGRALHSSFTYEWLIILTMIFILL